MKKDSPIVRNLVRAKQCVEHGWVQGTFCLSRYGHRVEPGHELADSYCPLGAIGRATGTSSLRAAHTIEASYLARAIRKKNNPFAIIAFNDAPETTRDTVLKAFSKAITLARRETNPHPHRKESAHA